MGSYWGTSTALVFVDENYTGVITSTDIIIRVPAGRLALRSEPPVVLVLRVYHAARVLYLVDQIRPPLKPLVRAQGIRGPPALLAKKVQTKGTMLSA